jgi:hypothetical protein
MNQTINELGATLTSMNETQRKLLESREKEDRPLAIRGRLYLGDKPQPASYAAVDVVPLPEGKPAQRLLADEDGRFGTSSLTAGHYAVVANCFPESPARPILAARKLMHNMVSAQNSDARMQMSTSSQFHGILAGWITVGCERRRQSTVNRCSEA